MGLPTWILVQYHPKGTTTRTEIELRLYHGKQVVSLMESGIDVPAVLQWPLAAVDWDALRSRLTQPYNTD
jgi:hypothetical protein